MKVFGLAGWSGSGKTTLLIRLIPEFVARGISVSTIKHAHHGFDIDQPGKDSHAHRMAGAREVMVSSGRRFALMHELRGAPRARFAHIQVIAHEVQEGLVAHEAAGRLQGVAIAARLGLRDELEP